MSQPGQASKLYDEFCEAHNTMSLLSIQQAIDVTPDLLVMAWEEATDESESKEGSSSNLLTPASLIELVHAHTATSLEKYMAWKFLQSEMSHVFFKEIKLHGRVVSFKAKLARLSRQPRKCFAVPIKMTTKFVSCEMGICVVAAYINGRRESHH